MGSDNALPLGAVKAIKALGLRVPADAPDAHRELADEALQRIVDVMREDVDGFKAGAVLKAATHLRDEICGPLAQKLKVAGDKDEPLEVVVRTESA